MTTAAATTWGAGDYAQMGHLLEPAAAAVVNAAAVAPGERVCDIATGTGNAALLAAARGGRTTGVDLEPTLLRIAERRARDAQLGITWVRGDAQALPLADHSADVALSVFGTMYAADHRVTACEIRRLCAEGVRVVLASWVPGSFMPSMGKTLSAFLPPPPPATGPPSAWGDPGSLGLLLADAGLMLTWSTRHSGSRPGGAGAPRRRGALGRPARGAHRARRRQR